jgi:hypothetical protein
MEAPSVADDCSDLEHGRRHTPNACAGKESAASAARSIPGSEACPPGERVVVPPKGDSFLTCAGAGGSEGVVLGSRRL